jgi:hypothetical protein
LWLTPFPPRRKKGNGTIFRISVPNTRPLGPLMAQGICAPALAATGCLSAGLRLRGLFVYMPNATYCRDTPMINEGP